MNIGYSIGLSLTCLVASMALGQEQRLDRTQPDSGAMVKEIEALIYKQQEAWNQGDIEAFMIPYWKSEELTFSGGGQITRGWQATLDRYKAKYPRDQMGKLKFDGLESRILSENAALVLGNYHLEMSDGLHEGNFSLVWQRFPEGWKIIHDHSSSNPEKNQ